MRALSEWERRRGDCYSHSPPSIQGAAVNRVPPPAQLWLLATGHFLPRCLHVVAELGVADHLGDAPVKAEALARDTGCDAISLARMLRLLAVAGLFDETPAGWTHTDLSKLLR